MFVKDEQHYSCILKTNKYADSMFIRHILFTGGSLMINSGQSERKLNWLNKMNKKSTVK